MPIEPFRPEHIGESWTNALQLQEPYRPGCRAGGGEQDAPFGLDRLDLLKKELKAVEFSDELRLEVARQWATITRPKLLQPCPATTVHRLVVADALREQQPLDPVDMLHPPRREGLALPADPALVLLLRRGGFDHGTDPRLTTLIGQERPQQGFAIDLISLGPAAAA